MLMFSWTHPPADKYEWVTWEMFFCSSDSNLIPENNKYSKGKFWEMSAELSFLNREQKTAWTGTYTMKLWLYNKLFTTN